MDFYGEDMEEEVIAEPEDSNTPSNLYNGLVFLQTNGWYILMLLLLIYYLWKSKISKFIERWRKQKEDEEEVSRLKKVPDLYKAREEARRAAIWKFQNNYNEQAVKMKLAAEEKEKKKREAIISKNLHLFAGRRLNEDDFTPLTGTGGVSCCVSRQTFPSSPSGNR